MPAPVPSAAGLAARAALATPYYGLVQLALADIAYSDPKAQQMLYVSEAVFANVGKLPPLPTPPQQSSAIAGTWHVEWGPAFSLDYSNLIYGVTYRETSTQALIYAGVAIRGTDVYSTPGLIPQLIQDLNGATTVTMSMPTSTAPQLSVAKGTNDGLNLLVNLKPDPLLLARGTGTVCDWVQSIYAEDPTAPIVVTGHSLGGCQTTVVATYLYYYLANYAGNTVSNIIPNPFAAPTAGLTDFATNFNTIFPTATLWWNTIDIVPNAFQQNPPTTNPPLCLQNITGFWGNYGGPALPDKCADTKQLSPQKWLQQVISTYPKNYQHPTQGAQVMSGFVWTPPTSCANDWLNQLEIQHFPPMYHRLISTQTAVSVAPFPLPTLVSKPNQCTAVPSA
jgi:hypothetical protein